jgi:heavy metal sensor kinase
LGAGCALLAIGLGGGWWLTSRAIRPIEDISAAASRIAEGNLSERITGVDTGNETGRLAAVLNSTFARLEAAFAEQKQFTADASHELRTPLAVLISEAQTALARERSQAEYRESFQACLATAQQMRRLTESLLQLARLDAGQENGARTPFDLADRVLASVRLIRSLADARGITIHCDLAPTEIRGDSERMGQLITNLLGNAIRYNKERGEIRIETRVDGKTGVLLVSDTGQGISEQDQPHIFERFYRADKSRSRVEGGTGLGLAICKAIVEMHGGKIEVASRIAQGSTFTVRLPRGERCLSRG